MSRQFRQGFFVAALLSALAGFGLAQTAVNPSSATLTTLVNFGNGNGQYPEAQLAQGLDGNFYGTTYRGAAHPSEGIAYNITPAGILTTFGYPCTTNYCTGSKASSGFVLAGDGNLYGTTAFGGNGPYRNVNHAGTVMQLNPQIGLTTIYNFCSQLGCQDGDDPYYSLTLGSDGNLYGATTIGGLHNQGTFFSVTPQGVWSKLYDFDGSNSGPSYPGAIVQATDGYFYGTASGGTGAFCQQTGGCGTVFKLTAQGVLTTIYSFCSQPNCTDGYGSGSGLIQAVDGNLYGVSGSGLHNGGTIFKITPKGALTTLYSFCALANCADGTLPTPLVQGTDGNFYGATIYGGGGASCYISGNGCGSLFKLTSTGVLTTLYSFCPLGGATCPDGASPQQLTQGTDGNFYAVTYQGGSTGYGTSFKLATGLGPFVRTVTSSGKVGASVIILGTNLTGATKVTFNGVSAAFTVVSSSEITATVPAGTKTGAFVVTTPSASLKSNKNFQVTK